MDQIKFALTEIEPYEKTKYKGYDVKVVLNGTPLKHSIFNGGQVVPASRFDFAEFDLFTCSCGVPGCAGFFIEVIQNKTQDTVKWTFPNDNSYAVDKLEYEFNRTQFEQEFEQLRTKMLELEKEDTHLVVNINDAQSYVGYEDDKEEERFEVKDTLEESFKWYEDRFEAKKNFNLMLKENFPELYNNTFHLKYEENIGSDDLDLSYLVCRSGNEWPRKENEKEILQSAKLVGKAIEKAILQKDYQQFIEIVHNAYKEFSQTPENDNFNESVWFAFEFDLYKLVEQKDFDVSKFSILIN